MTSEKRFALSHSGFWNSLLPMEEHYIRARNLGLRRFAPELLSILPAAERGTVNECAYLVFVASVESRVGPRDLPTEIINRCADEALQYIGRMREFSSTPQAPLGRLQRQEAIQLATLLDSFFAAAEFTTLRPKPYFPGCGWIDDAHGDVLGDQTLFEIKAGHRQFRSSDVRQLLSYCALDFSARMYGIDSVCLINPRSGTYFQDDLETLCQRTAGMSALDVLGEIVNYISEPLSLYRPT